MNAHKHALAVINFAFYKNEMFKLRNAAAVHFKSKAAVYCGKINLFDFLDEIVDFAAIRDKVGNRHHLKAVLRGKRPDIIKARHIAIVLHYLAAKTNFFEPCKAAEIDRSLRMPGAP